jgi:ElaB/YqjD/DUF883 family membrane-anchored ribosome-binding protein
MKNRNNLTLRKKTHDGVDKMMDKAESIGESSKKKIESFKEKSQMVKNNVDGYIKENPEKSVLIATGIGLIIGAIITTIVVKKK